MRLGGQWLFGQAIVIIKSKSDLFVSGLVMRGQGGQWLFGQAIAMI